MEESKNINVAEEDLFAMCANKSASEIKEMRENGASDDVIRQAVRYYLNRRLADGKIECMICLEESAWVEEIEMDETEGLISCYVEYEGWYDIDDLSTDCLLQIVDGLEDSSN